jgi:hypothetical protein
MDLDNSNLQNEIESQLKSNFTLSRQMQILEKLPQKDKIIKDKKENSNEKTDILNTPSSY